MIPGGYKEIVAAAIARGWIKLPPPVELTAAGTPRKQKWWRGHSIYSEAERRERQRQCVRVWQRKRRAEYLARGLTTHGTKWKAKK